MRNKVTIDGSLRGPCRIRIRVHSITKTGNETSHLGAYARISLVLTITDVTNCEKDKKTCDRHSLKHISAAIVNILHENMQRNVGLFCAWP